MTEHQEPTGARYYQRDPGGSFQKIDKQAFIGLMNTKGYLLPEYIDTGLLPQPSQANAK